MTVMRLFLLILSLSAVTAFGEEVVNVRGFGGLNTISNEFEIQNNEATLAHNVEFRKMRALSKRYGYDSISTASGFDSIIAIYPAYYSDGTEQLFIVADTHTYGFGRIYVTAKGSADISSLTQIWNYWSVYGYPSFAMVNNEVYIVNGYNRGIVYSDGLARSYPPKSPAEPTIVPLNDSGTLNGTYRYVLYIGDTNQVAGTEVTDTTITCYECTYWKGSLCLGWQYSRDASDSCETVITVDTVQTSTESYQSIITAPVKIDNGQMFLTNFTFRNIDSARTSFPDGARIIIARTRGDYLRITETTPIYYVADFLVPTRDSADNYVYIDTSSDITISNGKRKIDYAIDNTMRGLDSLGNLQTNYGAPGFVSHLGWLSYTGQVSGGTDSTHDYGVFHGIPKQTDTLGTAYWITLIDTVTGVEGDTGRGCYIFVDNDLNETGNAKPYGYQISIPKTILDDSGYVINLYRSLIQQVTYDSSYWAAGNYNIWNGANMWEQMRLIESSDESGFARQSDTFMIDIKNKVEYKWVDYLAVDTIVAGGLYLRAQLSITDTLFSDSLRYDSLVTRRRFFKSAPPALLNNIFAFNGRLYGINGSRLWRSGLLNADTLQYWGQMDFQSLNEDDGDIGTVAFPTRQSIRFFKNRSNYNIYDDFSKTEISGDWGCIAPRSHAAGINGHYYLTGEGVVRETEGGQLERTTALTLVSAKLDNFDKLDILTKSRAIGFYNPRGKQYWLNIGDTTYVYDERSDAWATWSLPFSSAFLYGVDSEVEFIPGDTVYFVKPGDSVLYRYGTSETDNGTIPQVWWRSAPIGVDEYYESVVKTGLWTVSDSSYDSVGVWATDPDGSTMGVSFYNDMSKRYGTRSISSNEALYFYINLTNQIVSPLNIGDAYFDGIDVYYNRTRKETEE